MIGPVIATMFLVYLAWIIVIQPAAWIIGLAAGWIRDRRLHKLNQEASVQPFYPWERS
jgi:hypothetical protein